MIKRFIFKFSVKKYTKIIINTIILFTDIKKGYKISFGKRFPQWNIGNI